MKNKSNFVVFVFLIIAVFFLGCSSSKIPNDLVGSWKYGGAVVLVINSDGSGTIDGQVCTWSVIENTLKAVSNNWPGDENTANYTLSDDKQSINFSNARGALIALSYFPILRK